MPYNKILGLLLTSKAKGPSSGSSTTLYDYFLDWDIPRNTSKLGGCDKLRLVILKTSQNVNEIQIHSFTIYTNRNSFIDHL